MFGTLQLHKKTSAIRYSKNIFCCEVLHYYLTHEFKEKIEVLFKEYLYIDMLWKWNIL